MALSLSEWSAYVVRSCACDTWQRARHDSDATLGVRALRTWHLRRAGVCTEILDRSAALHSPRGPRTTVVAVDARGIFNFFLGFLSFRIAIAARGRFLRLPP